MRDKNEVRFNLNELERSLLNTIAASVGLKPTVIAKHYLLDALRKQQEIIKNE